MLRNILFILVAVLSVGAVASANDAPHSDGNVMTCESCHYSSPQSPFWGGDWTNATNIDDTPFNRICTQCHVNDLGAGYGLGSAPFVKTHSSGAMGVSGSWSIECRVCHHPHQSRQYMYYRRSDAALTIIAQGTITGIGAYNSTDNETTFTYTLTSAKAGWTVPATWAGKTGNSERGLTMYPDITVPAYNYEVVAADATTITVSGNPTAVSYFASGDTFALAYGQMLKERIAVPVGSSTYRTVKFLDNSGNGSFTGVTGANPVNGVCQVCHTTTNYWRNDGTLAIHNVGANCTSCHSHAKGFGASCTSCHGAPPVVDTLGGPNGLAQVDSNNTGSSFAGKHETHVTTKGYGCDACHYDSVGSGATHNNGDYKITMGFYGLGGGTQGGIYNGQTTATYNATTTTPETTANSSGTMTCQNIYCHSSGQSSDGTTAIPYQYSTPSWTGSAACGTCHPKDKSGGSAVVSGSHGGHLTTTLQTVNCSDCHTGVATDGSTYSSASHVNGQINVANTYNSTGAPGNGYGTCSSASCHDNGRGTLVTTPTWGASVAQCSECHAVSPTTGSHQAHLATYACAKCHKGAVQGSTPSVEHLDTNVDVYNVTSGDLGYPANKAKGSAFSSCSNMNCHGGVSPTWGTDYSANDNCTTCHGTKTAGSDGSVIAGANPEKVAPGGTGTDTSGNSAADSPRVGAHQAHLTADSGYTTDVLCSECHTVPGTIGAAGHLDATLAWDGHADVTFSGRAVANGASPSYNSGTGTCSSVYCHGAKMLYNSYTTDTSKIAPVWTNTAYLTGTPSLSGDCATCHDSPPKNYAPTSHNGSETFANCSGCHDHVDTDGSFLNVSLHMNGTVEAAGCTGCHGQPPVDAGTLISSPATTGHTEGAHQAHWTKFSGSGCGICHAGGGTSDAGHMTPSWRKITMGFTYGKSVGTFNTEAYNNSYTATWGDAGTTVNNGQAAITCSSIYCHGYFGGNGNNATPTWDNSASAGCGTCHDVDTGTMEGGSHEKHVNTAGFTCDYCHAGTATNAAGGIGNEALHVNALLNWDLDESKNQISGSSTYRGSNSGTRAANLVGTSYDSCASIYCHSNVQTSPPGGALTYSTPTWGGTAACGSCHKGDASPVQDTGSHTAHVNDGTIMADKPCSACHVGAGSGSSKHANYEVNVNIDSTYGGTYAGTLAPGDSYSACSSVYCHSSGEASPSYKTPTWNTTINDCESCHGGTSTATNKMATGNHTEHMNNASVIGTNYGCQKCHNATTSDGTSITTPANHVNKSRDVAGADIGSWSSPTCSNVYCHSTGQATPTYATVPNWGSATDLTCDSCHGVTSTSDVAGMPDYTSGAAGSATANSHGAHVSVSADCDKCHTNTTTSGTAIKAGSTIHTDGTRNVDFNTAKAGASASYSSGSKTCSSVTCHGTSSTPTWGGTLDCAGCHLANNTLAGTHGKHYGTATVATNRNDSRAADSTAYLYNCGVCHNVVTSDHGSGNVSTNQAAQVIFGANHAIGGDYAAGALAPTAPDTGGFNWTNGTCSNTYCHSQGTSTSGTFGGGPNVSPTWGGASLNCAGCHRGTTTANIMESGAHTAHVNDGTIMTNKACSVCHVSTTSDSTNITNEDLHVNKVKNVTITASWDSDATPDNNWNSGTTSCSSVYCHSSGQASPSYVTVSWGTTISNCTACHGGAGTSTTLTASHLPHIGTDATDTNKQFGYTCDDCHTATTSNGTSITTPANHVNNLRDVAVASANGGTGTIGGNFSGGTCSSLYCHGTTTPSWTTGATTGNCSACHGMTTPTFGYATARDTNGDLTNTDPQVGAHAAHLNATHSLSSPIGCSECHNTTVTNMAAQSTYVNKVNAAGHIGSALPAELTFGTLADTLTATSIYGGAPGGTCSNTYCHDGRNFKNAWSTATDIDFEVPDWNTPMINNITNDTDGNPCDNCHGNPPSGHVANSNCTSCHTHVNTSNNGFKPDTDPTGGWTLHINGVIDGGGDNCSDCHSAAGGPTPGTTPDTTHATHVGSYFVNGKVSTNDYGSSNPDWLNVNVGSSTTQYRFGCGNCHPMTTSSHLNNSVDVTLNKNHGGTVKSLNGATTDSEGYTQNNTTPGYQAGTDSVVCSSVYCHSNGYATSTVFATTPNWYGGAFSGDKCANCHGNSPNTSGKTGSPAHEIHVVGIHYDDLYNGTTGLMTAGTTGTNSHGNADYSTTINCNVCHSGTTTSSGNDQNTVCATASCHGAGGLTHGTTAIASFLTHVNGTPNVALVNHSGTLRSKAQIRSDGSGAAPTPWTRNNGYKAANSFDSGSMAPGDYSGGTCTTACHLNQAVQWNSGVTCYSCHKSLPQ